MCNSITSKIEGSPQCYNFPQYHSASANIVAVKVFNFINELSFEVLPRENHRAKSR